MRYSGGVIVRLRRKRNGNSGLETSLVSPSVGFVESYLEILWKTGMNIIENNEYILTSRQWIRRSTTHYSAGQDSHTVFHIISKL
jgi:hypothetical protein